MGARLNPIDKAKHPNVWRGYQYALEVVSGQIPNSIYIIGACNRFLRDYANREANYYFNPDAAEKYLRLVQKFEHVKGKWATKHIHYEPWQCWMFANVMGFLIKETNFRRFRVAHIEVPRGCGKSLMASQALLYFLALDNPIGNEISTLATRKEQARIVLDSARAMANKAKSFLKNTGVKVLAHKITHDKSNSMARALAADSSGLDGLNDILAICDELHAMNRETFEVVSSGMSKRSDSLLLCITTAGFDVDSVGYSQSEYAKAVAIGKDGYDDDTFFSAVYTIDENDNIHDELSWRKANPNYGISVDPVTFTAKAKKALVTPADLPNFKVKHLNIWISEASAFYDVKEWDACADTTLKVEDFLNNKEYELRTAIDLASHIDLTVISLIFKKRDEEIYYIFERTYIPQATVDKLRNNLYDEAIAKGQLIVTKGEAINYDEIKKDLINIAKQHKILECLYDAWNATEMAQQVSAMNSPKIEMVKIGMNVGNMSEPTKKLDVLMRQRKIRHAGSVLFRWNIGNVVAKEDANGNVYPRKSHERLKIDMAIGTLMALAGWLQDDQKRSVYETRGIRIL